MAAILLFLGLIVALVGGIWLIVVAFQDSVLWGLGSIFIPFVSLVFAIMHWDVAKKPVLIHVVGFVLMIVGAALMDTSTTTTTLP